MKTGTSNPEAPAAAAPVAPAAAVAPATPPAPAPAAAAPEIDEAKVKADSVKTERTRIAAILNCEEAKGRENLARTIALETDSDPEAARKLLAAAPIAGTPVAPNALAVAMAGLNNPKVGEEGAPEHDKAAIASVLQFASKKGKVA